MKKWNRVACAACAVVLFVLMACGGEETRQIDNAALQTDPPETETNPSSPASPGGSSVVPEVESGQPLAVALQDGSIAFPAKVAPGPMVVNVQNSGTMQHSLTIEPASGNAVSLDMPLEAGQSGSQEVVLAEGSARVFCPVLDHASKGESIEVQVVR